MSLRNCLSKHINSLDPEDAQFVKTEARRLEDAGMSREKAERQAIERAIEDVEDSLEDVRRQLIAQGVPVALKPVQGEPQAEEAPEPTPEPEPVKEEPKPEPEPKAEPLKEETTGIKNAISAETRKRLGLPERETPETRTFEEMYAAGKKLAAEDPMAINRLLDDLTNDPEKVIGSEKEAGLMLKHKVDLENGLHDLLAKRKEAEEAGDPNGVFIVNQQLKEHRSIMRTFTELTEQAGTAAGRALASRKMMSAMDHSLVHMEADAEAAKGAPLDEKELDNVRAMHEKILAKNKALEEQLKTATDRVARAEAGMEIERLKREVAEKLAAPAMGRLSKAADAARKRIKARGIQFNAGIDPIQLIDLSIIGAEHIAKGISSFAKWSSKMVSEFGEAIRPHLKVIFDASEKRLAEGDPKQTVEKAEKKTTEEKIQARIDEGAELSELQPYLRTMALDIIRSGTTEREAVINELHAQVVKLFPNATKEETRDALSGYGKQKLLDKEEAKVILRELSAEAQKLAQLEALEKGKAPLATGVERQPLSEKGRALQKEVNAAKRKAGIVPLQGPGYLKSLLDSAKTRVRNQINDLQSEIDNGVRVVKGKPVPISDAELAALKESLAAVREHHSATFKKAGLTDEQRLEKAISFAKSNAEAWESRLQKARAGDFSVNKQAPVSSLELDAIKARIDAARAEYGNLKVNDPAQQADAVARSNAAYRERVAQRIADIRDRIARQDFAPRNKNGLVRDAASTKAQIEAETAQREWRAAIKRFEDMNRSTGKKIADAILAIPGLTKSLKASLDMSGIFRQGWRIMFTNPVIWQRNARKSFVDVWQTLGGKPVMDAINAEMKASKYYQKALRAKLAIGKAEEDFPSALPAKIPGVGRVFTASENAMTGFQYRNRMQVFEKLLDIAKASGVDIDDTAQLRAIAKVVNSLTARGDLGKLEPMANLVNVMFFSGRKLKGDWDALTAHALDSGMTPFARKTALTNLAKFAAGTAMMLMIASALGKDDTVEEDPRSSDFSKVKSGNARYDFSGGTAPIMTLVARLATLALSHFEAFSKVNSFKSSTSGKLSQINSGKFGAPDTLDVVGRFLRNKESPFLSVAHNWATGEVPFQRDEKGKPAKPDVTNTAMALLVPITIQTFMDLMNDQKATPESVMTGMAADFFGIGVNTYEPSKK